LSCKNRGKEKRAKRSKEKKGNKEKRRLREQRGNENKEKWLIIQRIF
jgi:hypothetical protein